MTHAETIAAFLRNPEPTDLDQCKAELAHALSHLGRSLEIEAELVARAEKLEAALKMALDESGCDGDLC